MVWDWFTRYSKWDDPPLAKLVDNYVKWMIYLYSMAFQPPYNWGVPSCKKCSTCLCSSTRSLTNLGWYCFASTWTTRFSHEQWVCKPWRRSWLANATRNPDTHPWLAMVSSTAPTAAASPFIHSRIEDQWSGFKGRLDLRKPWILPWNIGGSCRVSLKAMRALPHKLEDFESHEPKPATYSHNIYWPNCPPTIKRGLFWKPQPHLIVRHPRLLWLCPTKNLCLAWTKE